VCAAGGELPSHSSPTTRPVISRQGTRTYMRRRPFAHGRGSWPTSRSRSISSGSSTGSARPLATTFHPRRVPQAEHQKLQSTVAGQARSDRRRWVVGGVAAAAVAAAVAVVIWTSDPFGYRSSPPPTRAPDSTETTSLAAAEGVVAAFVNNDAAGAAPYLAPGTKAPWPEWPVHMKRDAAWGVKYLMEPCVPTTTTSDLTVFACPFAMHLLGSREVGKGLPRQHPVGLRKRRQGHLGAVHDPVRDEWRRAAYRVGHRVDRREPPDRRALPHTG
jgi:hypothetical protein